MLIVEGHDGPYAKVGGRRLLSFAGCDYLGLARDREVIAAAARALGRYGLSAGASRTTTGSSAEHRLLEEELASWQGCDDAVLLSSGWLSDGAVASALAPEHDGVVLLGAAHPALEAAARDCGLPLERGSWPESSAGAFCGNAERFQRPLWMTDAHDLARGVAAPLADLARRVQRDGGSLLVDDAHGVGVLGPGGRGTADRDGARGPRIVVAGTLSKALGVQGGFVAASVDLCRRIRERSPAYGGATPIPPALAAAARVALEVARGERGEVRRAHLGSLARLAAERLRPLGFAGSGQEPWLSCSSGSAEALRRLSEKLSLRGFLVPYLKYSSAHAGGFLRVSISALHESAHVEALAQAVAAEREP
ncbi:MAG: aminotransferase class I/II-fold pyridoxal phosphate-dependent enzyme [Planctomycetes bacterium]|nr:aminotransferase class I/II-fold pyridoxal phosphate-dependent enzyme [Planctomycetota bacterium]